MASFIVYVRIFFNLLSEFFKNALGLRKMCESKAIFDGKVVVITGGNTGIGKETAYQLSLRGARYLVIIACRDLTKANNAIKDILAKNPKAKIRALKLDLSSLKSVRLFAKSFAKEESHIDILINNAGIFMCPEWKTEDGFEMQFGTNHLGHFLLTLSLLPLLRKSPNARIVNVSAKLHVLTEINFENINLRNGAYTPLKAYAQSKLANILFTQELAKRLRPNSKISTYSLHPGVIRTELARHLPLRKFQNVFRKIFFINEEMGSQTTLFCALEESLEDETGLYYDNCERVDNMLPHAIDFHVAKKLWEMSSDLVKLESHLQI